MRKQLGWTTTELAVVLFFVVWLAAAIGIVWIAIHFITKFW